MKNTEDLKAGGTWREDRHGERSEGIKPDSTPEPPEHLNEEEAAIFTAIADLMQQNNTLAKLDVFVLEQYSVQLALFRMAKKELATTGKYVVTHVNKAGNANEMPSPWCKILKDSSSEMLKLSAKLGLSPVDRNKASTTGKNINDSEGLIK